MAVILSAAKDLALFAYDVTPPDPSLRSGPPALQPSRRQHLRRLVRPGVDAVSRLWLPFVSIQFLGLLLVLAYFNLPAVARICDAAGALKGRYGLLFAAISMPIACGIMPETFKWIAGVDRSVTVQRLSVMVHNMVLYSVGGVCVDLFYLWLSHRFAGPATPANVVAKVLLDQLVYTPLVGAALVAVSYTFRNNGYRPLATLRSLNGTWYTQEVMPVLVTCWAYWFPMTTLMYTLPTQLTFVYGLVANAASATLLTAVAGRHERKVDDPSVDVAGVIHDPQTSR